MRVRRAARRKGHSQGLVRAGAAPAAVVLRQPSARRYHVAADERRGQHLPGHVQQLYDRRFKRCARACVAGGDDFDERLYDAGGAYNLASYGFTPSPGARARTSARSRRRWAI